jgi:hypothetical protein
MISKQASTLAMAASGTLTGAMSGLLNAHLLDKDEKRILTRKGKLNRDANLTARNTARGAIGGTLGSGMGYLASALLRKPSMAGTLSMGGGMMGAGIGSAKYSKPYAAANRLKDVESKLRRMERKIK